MGVASVPSKASYPAERIEQLLRCPICLSRLKSPKLLPCQHTFCRSPCLEGVWGGHRRTIRCPECRVEHRVPADGVSGFPNNISLSGFLDLAVIRRYPSASNPIEVALSVSKCSVCGDDKETRQCVHCDKIVCPLCRHSHLAQMRLGIGHQLTQLRDGLPQLARSLEAQWKSTQVKGVVDEINSSIDAQVLALRDRQKVLVSKVDSFVQKEQKALQLGHDRLPVYMAKVTSYCAAVERAYPSFSEAGLVEFQRLCTKDLNMQRQVVNTVNNLTPLTRYTDSRRRLLLKM